MDPHMWLCRLEEQGREGSDVCGQHGLQNVASEGCPACIDELLVREGLVNVSEEEMPEQFVALFRAMEAADEPDA